MIVICVLGCILIYFMIDHTLKPLIDLDEKMKQINEDNLNQRIEITGGNNEVVSLSKSFNIMLTRLEKSFANQKRFVANVTHELKTPLTIIKTNIEVLKLDEEPTVEDYKENLEVVEKSTQRLINVVENLLELMNESREEFDEVVSVNELVTAVLEELQSIITEKHLVIYKKCEEYYVKGNATLLYRALFNLIENATKYNKENGKIEIEVKRKQEEIEIVIKDNGIGIPADSLENIFEAFYRVDSSRGRQLGGAGLGLTLTRHIIEKHKGCIKVESKEGKGTLFKVKLKEYHKKYTLKLQSLFFMGHLFVRQPFEGKVIILVASI